MRSREGEGEGEGEGKGKVGKGTRNIKGVMSPDLFAVGSDRSIGTCCDDYHRHFL